MTYLVQIDGTDPKNWREVCADDPKAAIIQAITPLIQDGHNPETAYIALAWPKFTHSNGGPMAVQSYRLHVNREQAA